jgi:hypothetical protein
MAPAMMARIPGIVPIENNKARIPETIKPVLWELGKCRQFSQIIPKIRPITPNTPKRRKGNSQNSPVYIMK